MSIANGQVIVHPKDIAEELLGTTKWEENETKGYCTCPGEHLHSGQTGDRDCVVYLNDVATIFCLHQCCLDEVKEANCNLRKAIADGEPDVSRKPSPREVKHKQKAAQRRSQLEIRGRSSLSKVLKEYQWKYEQILKDTKDAPSDGLTNQWRQIIELFKPDDVIWIGNKFDSGKSEHQGNFRTAEQWLNTPEVLGQLTCPAGFKTTSISRNNDNVLHRRFLVVESDILSKDDVGAIFKWLRDEVGLNLRAIVDTAGKSLHGWFDYPKKPLLEELEIILPQLGCDAGLFRASQPCRIPGALRDGKYQRLVYLDKSTMRRVWTRN